MKVFVVYGKAGIHSGRALAAELKKLYGAISVEHGGTAELIKSVAKNGQFDFVINVGWYQTLANTGKVILNTPGSVAYSSNKRKARVAFDNEKVPAPKLWLNPGEIVASDLPVIGRTTHHAKARGFHFCEDMEDVRRAARPGKRQVKRLIRTKKGNKVWRDRFVEEEAASHYIKFIPNTREFRVHAFCTLADASKKNPEDYVVLKLSEKVAGEKAKDSVIKNHENGWVFSYPEDKKDPLLAKVREAGKKAVAIFGLNWGAADVIASKDTGEVYVLEVNSTPCLTDDSANTLDKYAKAFGSLIGTTPPMQPKKKKAPTKSYSNPKDKKKALRNILNRINF